ncbi:Ribonuclease H [Yarrowia sp. C11]|nr:Ribonuclease H [Yarrowia sp. C11]KAG5364009.1 Ribonuclease H [Yarrowia sp. E02]
MNSYEKYRMHPGPYYTVHISHEGAQTYTDLKEAQKVVMNYPDSHPEVHTTWAEADEYRESAPKWEGLYTVDEDGQHRYVVYVTARRDLDYGVGGIGVWFGENNPCNFTGPLEECGISQKRAELFAVYQALQIIDQRSRLEKWQIRLNSKPAIRSLTTELEETRKNHWKNDEGQLVPNADLYFSINRWIFKRTFYGDIFSFKHVCNPLEDGNRQVLLLAERGLDEPLYVSPYDD